MQKTINLFYRILEIILVLLLAGMSIMVFVNVVMRYTMNSGINISEELSRYFFVWLTFIGASAMSRLRLDFSMTLLTEHLSKRGAMLMKVAGSSRSARRR